MESLISEHAQRILKHYSIQEFAAEAEKSVLESSNETEILRGIKPNLEKLLSSKIS